MDQRAAHLALLGVALVVAPACGSSEARTNAPTPSVAADREDDDRAASPSMEIQGEVGGLDGEQVADTFANSGSELTRCWQQGTGRLDALAGSIAFFLRIGQGGKVVHVQPEKSTLGDRQTERCMLEVLRAQRWPRPVGGKTGIARGSMEFETSGDVRSPRQVPSEEFATMLQASEAELGECKRDAATRFSATVYLKRDYLEPSDGGADAEGNGGADAGTDADAGPIEVGRAIAVGLASKNETNDEVFDCLVGVLESAVYPTPGSAMAKGSFTF